MSPQVTTTPTSLNSTEPILTVDLVKTLDSHDRIRYIGTASNYTWTEPSWGGKARSQSVGLTPNKVYTIMYRPYKDSGETTWHFSLARKWMKVWETDLSQWTIAENRHDKIVLQEKQKRAWTMASKTFPRIRSMFGEATSFGRTRVKYDLKDLELSKKMELLTKLTPSELGLLEFLEQDSKNPTEDIKRLFEIYHLYTSQQNDQKIV